MEKPFVLISGNMAHRDEFDVKEGHQPTWALLYIKEGSFELDLGKGTQRIGSGDTIIFDDSTVFHRSVLTHLVFVYIKFKINLRCPFSVRLPVGRIEFKDKERFLSTIRSYESVLERDDRRTVYYKEHLLEDVLLQIFTENDVGDKADNINFSNDVLIGAASAYVREHIEEKISIEDMCRAANTNPSTLNWRFRRETGMSVGEYITHERIRLAKKLLQGTTYGICRIASKCGYENQYYFSTAFKKNCGMSPREYRQKYE